MRCRLLLLAAACASSGAMADHARRTELRTPLVTQQTASWCWAASASMALKLLGFPDINPARNYQCGIVAAAFPNCEDDCTKCDRPIGTMMSFVGMFNRYRALALSDSNQAVPQIDPTYVANPMFGQIKHSLDLSHPVIAGISPDQVPDRPEDSEHAVLITGYDDDYLSSGEPWLIIRDPYPYAEGQSPWTKAGYPFTARTGRALVPWRVLHGRMNLTSAVFFERPEAERT